MHFFSDELVCQGIFGKCSKLPTLKRGGIRGDVNVVCVTCVVN